jgi:hypothetical protein
MGTGWLAGGAPGGRRRLGAVPVTLAHDVLTVALADPTNVLALDDIRLATKLASVRTAVATASDIKEAVNRYYYGGASARETFGSLADVEGLKATEEREKDLEQVGGVDDAPVVRLVNAIMGEALHSRASHIHVEPQERDVRVRYRIDGLLREVTVVPKAIQGPLISRIRRLDADTRVSSMPTMHGETVVIRLLRKETEKAKTLAGRTTLEEVPRVTPPTPTWPAGRAAAPVPSSHPRPGPPPPKTPAKVLVLDDDSTIAEVAAVLVDGYEVVAASHLDEGLRMVESGHPDRSWSTSTSPAPIPASCWPSSAPAPATSRSWSCRPTTTTTPATGPSPPAPPASSPSPPASPSSAPRSPPSSSTRRPGRPPRLSGSRGLRQTAGRRCRCRRPGGCRWGSTSGLQGGCRR